MKKLACYILIAVLGIAFAINEAMSNAKEIMSKSQSDRMDVFKESIHGKPGYPFVFNYVLEFKPIYKYKTRPYRIPTFLKGIKGG